MIPSYHESALLRTLRELDYYPSYDAPLRSMTEYLTPHIEYMKDGSAIVSFDLPGVPQEDVNIQAQGEYLRISGERKGHKEGKFQSVLRVDPTCDLESIQATMKLGVLSITVPQKVSVKPKRIPIN